MKLISITGENVPPSKGGSPAETFDRSIVTWEENGQQKTLTVTYVRYFAKVLAERGIYDEAAEKVPVNHLAALLFAEKYPNTPEKRHYINDTETFLALFEGFSLAAYMERYPGLIVHTVA
ncbi:hypothetical protein ACFSO0_00670 [Brevibacillus sp. GCM10020057]|uniref:hypothetical protein n=1 Tax=Brevibacillus sp. GCM10020057 TaxID=3317327 RepID=UPI0036374BB3